MNRRSMIKHAALGATGALLVSDELTAQSRGAKPNVVLTKAAKQVWKYKFVPDSLNDCEQAGREMWEAVGFLENGSILFKQPA